MKCDKVCLAGSSVIIAVSLLAVYLLKMALIRVTKVTVFRNTMVLRGKTHVWFPGRACVKKDPGAGLLWWNPEYLLKERHNVGRMTDEPVRH